MEESGSYLRVAPTEDIFDIIDNAHRVEGGHCGVRKTFCRVRVDCIFLYSAYIRTYLGIIFNSQIQEVYKNVPRYVVQHYVKLCTTCQVKTVQITRDPLKPIISKGFLTRCQVSTNIRSDRALHTYVFTLNSPLAV